jgi:hypothetical protein
LKIRNWSVFKNEVAELLFAKQLDEAYKDGIRIGAEFATRKLSFEVSLKSNLTLTKVESRGYDHALAAIVRAKEDIRNTTGASV